MYRRQLADRFDERWPSLSRGVRGAEGRKTPRKTPRAPFGNPMTATSVEDRALRLPRDAERTTKDQDEGQDTADGGSHSHARTHAHAKARAPLVGVGAVGFKLEV